MLRKLLITGFLSFCALVGFAQNVRDIRINEVLVFNETNLVDDYGDRSGWVELYNTSHSRINIGGCYLTAAKGNASYTYRIPSSDSRTSIGPHEYVIFYCDGTPTKGTFYTNFKLDKTGHLMFLNASGELIDEVKYSVKQQKPDMSLALVHKGEGMAWQQAKLTTVMASNETVDEQTGAEKFQERDSTGVVLAITAMSVVFSALLCLFLLFKLVGVIMVGMANKPKKASKTASILTPKTSSVSEETAAAIALAFKLHQEDLHDKESTVLTINRVARFYSPWSSKIYGINRLPN